MIGYNCWLNVLTGPRYLRLCLSAICCATSWPPSCRSMIHPSRGTAKRTSNRTGRRTNSWTTCDNISRTHDPRRNWSRRIVKQDVARVILSARGGGINCQTGVVRRSQHNWAWKCINCKLRFVSVRRSRKPPNINQAFIQHKSVGYSDTNIKCKGKRSECVRGKSSHNYKGLFDLQEHYIRLRTLIHGTYSMKKKKHELLFHSEAVQWKM